MDDRKNSANNRDNKHVESKGSAQHQDFLNHFHFTLATSDDARRRAFALRHEVFREELHYKLGENLLSQYENDRHDEHSILCLLTHKDSGMDAGCVRIVLAEHERDMPYSILPLEESCGDSLDHPDLHPGKFSRYSLCEVSRLAVRTAFRKAKNETSGIKKHDLDATRNDQKKNQSSLLIGISLFLAATALVGLSGRRHVFAMMEPRFARLLKASGLRFQQAGRLVDYHGPRAAFYIDQTEAENQLRPDLLPLYTRIKEELAKSRHDIPHHRGTPATC